MRLSVHEFDSEGNLVEDGNVEIDAEGSLLTPDICSEAMEEAFGSSPMTKHITVVDNVGSYIDAFARFEIKILP